MARTYANITTQIWRDPEFRALPVDAQWLYFVLLTQPDISPCGRLSMTLNRWAQLAGDMPMERLSEALRDLWRTLHVVVDWDEEELVVRTFVRWDGGLKVPNRVRGIISSVQGITSLLLQQVIGHELAREGVDPGIQLNPSGTLSEAIAKGSERFGVVVLRKWGTLQPSTHNTNPQPTTREPEGSATDETRGPIIEVSMVKLADTYCDRVKLSNRGKVAAVCLNAIGAGYSQNQIRDGLTILADEQRTVSADTLRIAIQGEAPNARGRPTNGTDQRIRDHLSLAARLGEESPPQIGAS